MWGKWPLVTSHWTVLGNLHVYYYVTDSEKFCTKKSGLTSLISHYNMYYYALLCEAVAPEHWGTCILT